MFFCITPAPTLSVSENKGFSDISLQTRLSLFEYLNLRVVVTLGTLSLLWPCNFFLHPVLRSCWRQQLELLLGKSWKAYYRIPLPGNPRLLCKWNWFPVFVFCVFGLPARPAAGFLFSRASKDNELQMVWKHLCLNIFLDNKTGMLLGLKFIFGYVS